MKPPSSSRTTLFLALGLLLAPSARAMEPDPATAPAQTDLVALHPCAIVGEKDKGKLQDYQAACATEMARGDVQLAPSEQVRAFLDKEPRKSCSLARQPTECLGRLATATRASRAVLITLTPGQLTRVSGLVVNPQGEVVDQKSIQIRSRGQPQGELLRTALTRLREQLNLIPLKPTPLVQQPPPPPLVETPPPAQPPEPTTGMARAEPAPTVAAPTVAAPPEALAVRASSTGRTWKTPAAYASAGAGVVALGLAGFFAISSNGDVARSNEFYKDNTYPAFNQLDEIVRLRDDAHTKRIVAGVSAGVGAALIGAGAYLWFQDRPAAPAPGVAALSVGPGGVSVLGFLP